MTAVGLMISRWGLNVLRPDAGLGNILSDAGLGPSTFVAGDEIPARQSTLKAIETASGGPVIKYIEQKFALKGDPGNLRGAFKSAGSRGIALHDYLRTEGLYTFHAKATYGECKGTRESVWTLHVDVGIDPARTDVKTDPLGAQPDGSEGVRLTFTPRDKYGNRLGPGRTDDLTVSGSPGSTITTPTRDLNDGSYQVDLVWDPASAEAPGITIGQPGRPPVSVGSTERRLFVYSVTFICGERKDDCCGCAPVRPGEYATEINIHNFSDRDAIVIKRLIPLVLSGAVRGREPKFAAITAVDRVKLPPHTATMEDCCRIQELLLGGRPKVKCR